MSNIPTDFTKLIPEMADWNNGDGIDVESWTGCSGSIELAIGYSVLFWPTFTEYDGCVLFAGFSEAIYRDFLKAYNGNRQAVEWVMNHCHIHDHFIHYGGKSNADQLVYLGRILKDIWQTKLAHDFPNRQFVVSFDETPVENLDDYQISFWQPINESPSAE